MQKVELVIVMATLNKYTEQGFDLYRKRDASTFGAPNIFYSQIEGACYEDDGYEDTGALAIVAMLRHQIDQGQGAFFSEALGLGRTTGEVPVSQEKHDAVLAQYEPYEEWYQGKYYNRLGEEAEPPSKKRTKAEWREAVRQKMIDVARTTPKILSADEIKTKETPKPKAPKVPKVPKAPPHYFTIQEDEADVELILQNMEATYKINIFRGNNLVANIASDIRFGTHRIKWELASTKRIKWEHVNMHVKFVKVPE